jgi:outer membrane murein-binding lipoprotein Lpp
VKSVPVWLWYTVLRIVLFAVPLAVLLIAGVNPWVSAAVAAVFGLSASLIFLRRPRESIATDLYAARHREAPAVRADDEEEDAALDATSPTTPAHEPEPEPEPEAEPTAGRRDRDRDE